LISFLVASRRVAKLPGSEDNLDNFEAWRMPRVQVAGMVTGIVATGFGVGFGIDQPVIATILGVLTSIFVTWIILKRPSAS